MNDRPIFAVTQDDVAQAILLCSIMSNNRGHDMRCVPHPCEHRDCWECAAAAIGASQAAIQLMVRAANAVFEAWSNPHVQEDEGLQLVAPRHIAVLDSPEGEAECLLRAGWLPQNWGRV